MDEQPLEYTPIEFYREYLRDRTLQIQGLPDDMGPKELFRVIRKHDYHLTPVNGKPITEEWDIEDILAGELDAPQVLDLRNEEGINLASLKMIWGPGNSLLKITEEGRKYLLKK